MEAFVGLICMERIVEVWNVVEAWMAQVVITRQS